MHFPSVPGCFKKDVNKMAKMACWNDEKRLTTAF